MLLTAPDIAHVAVNRGILAGILLSLGLALVCYYGTVRAIDSCARERFAHIARNAQYTINAQIKSYTGVLRAAASVLQSTPKLSREQFHQYAEGLGLDQHLPAIEAINYVAWVRDDQRDAFEAQVRREDVLAGNPRRPFQITPPGRRPTYSAVVYAEPDRLWADAVGTDLNPDPLAYKLLMESCDSGRLGSSGRPNKATASRNRVALSMRLPVYRSSAPLNSVEQRRAAYVGSIGIAFSVKTMVKGVVGDMPVPGVRMSLFNRVDPVQHGARPRSQLLYDSLATESRAAPPLDTADPEKFTAVLPVDFNGREWTAHFSVAKTALYSAADACFPWLALLAGFTTGILLCSLFHSLGSSRRRALEIAKGMTRELRASEAKLLLSHKKLRCLAPHAENVKEGERKRIAREIHDDLGQNLMVLRIDADLLASRTRRRHPGCTRAPRSRSAISMPPSRASGRLSMTCGRMCSISA